MKILITITRLVLGALYLISGLGYFFDLMPQPQLAGNAATFLSGLFASGYLLPVVKIVEALTGIALLANRYVALVLVVIFPVTLNILLFHLFLDPAGLAVGIILFAANLLLALVYRSNYRQMLNASPVTGQET